MPPPEHRAWTAVAAARRRFRRGVFRARSARTTDNGLLL